LSAPASYLHVMNIHFATVEHKKQLKRCIVGVLCINYLIVFGLYIIEFFASGGPSKLNGNKKERESCENLLEDWEWADESAIDYTSQTNLSSALDHDHVPREVQECWCHYGEGGPHIKPHKKDDTDKKRERCERRLEKWKTQRGTAILSDSEVPEETSRCWCMYSHSGPYLSMSSLLDDTDSMLDSRYGLWRYDPWIARINSALNFILGLLVILFLPFQGTVTENGARLLLVLITLLWDPLDGVCLFVLLLL